MANIVFTLGVLFSLSIAAYATYRMYAPILAVYSAEGFDWPGVQNFYITSILIGILFAILFGLGLRLKENVKVNLSLLFVATGINILAVETYFEFSSVIQKRSVPHRSGSEVQILSPTI